MKKVFADFVFRQFLEPDGGAYIIAEDYEMRVQIRANLARNDNDQLLLPPVTLLS